MKRTSLEANEKAAIFKPTHRQKILNVLQYPMTALDISRRTGLNQFQVSRRTSELERMNMITVIGERDGFSVYKLMEDYESDQLDLF